MPELDAYAPDRLEQYWMDWGFDPDPNNMAESTAQALASAVRYYAVKFGTDPTRAKIHNSQLNDELAVVAHDLGITLFSTTTAYNINHLLLSCGPRKSEVKPCPPDQVS